MQSPWPPGRAGYNAWLFVTRSSCDCSHRYATIGSTMSFLPTRFGFSPSTKNAKQRKRKSAGQRRVLIQGVEPLEMRAMMAAAIVSNPVWANPTTASANNNSRSPAVSHDGRYVAFESIALNLVPWDTNGHRDIFVRDMQTGNVALASVSAGGEQANAPSTDAAISADGRFVAFVSAATNLVAGDNNTADDIFLKDMQTGSIQLVSASSTGVLAGSKSWSPSLSGNGGFVAFASGATNLVANDTNGADDIFLKNLQTGILTRISTSAAGVESNGPATNPSLNGDGLQVSFSSLAANLTAGDINNEFDVFVKDLATGAVTLASSSSAGQQGNAASDTPALSADGRFVAFASLATNLVSGAGVEIANLREEFAVG